ncbi:MAG: DUF1415 domain-containing protein [Chitinophagales bacterium]|nr:DUF1415 domain-containing protein [Chitinophagales bacterium]MCZ2393172.1 DUF1415 domain-containing protein [Chitinophagales bacterium]
MKDELVIAHTKRWVKDVVIGLNLCPFANKEYKNNAIRYHVSDTMDLSDAMLDLIDECVYLDNNENISTTLLIFKEGFADFDEFLYLIHLSEKLLIKEKYEGIFQIASFHPEYIFNNSDFEDASNYTNRSPYPMIHILREDQLEEAIDNFPDTSTIPERNIELTRKLGIAKMKQLLAACFDSE